MNARRQDFLDILGVAAGLFLVLASLRVWLPSFTTIYGSAGGTPALELAAFCFAWVLPLVLVVPLARTADGRWLPLLFAVIAIAAFAVLLAGARDNVQLYASSIAASASLAWLIGAAARGWPARSLGPGLALALAASTWLALGTQTLDLAWLPAPLAWPLLVIIAAGLLSVCRRQPHAPGSSGAGPWFALLPALLIGGLVSSTIGRTWAGVAWPPSWWGGALVGVGSIGGILLVLRGGAGRRTWPLALVCLGLVALADLPRSGHALPAWIALPQALLALVLPAVLAGMAGDNAAGPVRRGVLAWAGVVAGVVLLATYYVAFDEMLPVPRPAFVLALAALVALPALAAPRTSIRPLGRGAHALGAAAMLAIVLTAWAARPLPPEPAAAPAEMPLRVMTWNIRYGISASGRFDPEEIAATIAAARPDILLLQEVDRGFLLNGSHDVLALLQRRLRMHAWYNAASEPLFGDAILSRWPLAAVEPIALPRRDVPTRPGVIAARLRLADGRELMVATTHLHTNDQGVSGAQVADLADHIGRWSADGNQPLILTGDFNIEPDDPRLAPLWPFLQDGLAAARPLPTSPSPAPREQIDHVFVTRDLRVLSAEAPRTTASDHLPVVVTITWQ